MSVEAGVTIIAICMLVITVGALVAAAAAVYALFALRSTVNNKVDEAMARVQPIIDQTASIAEQARQTAESVSAKVDAIAAKAEDTANRVGDRVQSVSQMVEDAISPQIVTAAGIVSTAAKCVQVYREFIKLRDEGRPRQEQVTESEQG